MSTLSQTIPDISSQFLAKIKKAFPNKVPDPNWTMEEVMYQAGQQNIIEWLIAHGTNESKYGGA